MKKDTAPSPHNIYEILMFPPTTPGRLLWCLANRYQDPVDHSQVETSRFQP
jgi:hypothetical protein